MFRDREQQNEVCRVLACLANAGKLWSCRSGPKARALDVIDGKDDSFYLSSGQELMLRIAVDCWSGRGHADFGKMLAVLDNGNLTAVATLTLALARSSSDGGTSIDEWINNYRKRTVSEIFYLQVAQELIEDDPPVDKLK